MRKLSYQIIGGPVRDHLEDPIKVRIYGVYTSMKTAVRYYNSLIEKKTGYAYIITVPLNQDLESVRDAVYLSIELK